ncbi:MAG: hypothetical protein LBQ16_06955 [Gracilibacteraceae bacterium]|jgi:hypothetical protein|nr:hypothetical protein [Gracilibacteraceae bacterium]
MTKSRSSSKSSLFLLEMIIAILFLAVASAVCMRLFVQAHVSGAASENLTRAVMVTQSLAENLRAAPAPEEWLSGAAGARATGPGEWVFCYDEDWRLLAADDAETAAFWLTVRRVAERDGLWQAEVAVSRPDTVQLFAITCTVYATPQEGAL